MNLDLVDLIVVCRNYAILRLGGPLLLNGHHPVVVVLALVVDVVDTF